MFVSKSISNIKVVVQPGTVQGFTKHKTLHYTGDNRGTGKDSGEEAEREKEKTQQRKRGGESLKSSHSWVAREKQGHIIFGRNTTDESLEHD